MKTSFVTLLLATGLAMLGCQEALDIKPDNALLVPTSLEDFQVLLDNDRYIFNREPTLGFIGAEPYYIFDTEWTSLNTDLERNAYLWQPEVYNNFLPPDWTLPYEQIFYANVVLEGLENLEISPEEQEQERNLRGSALFYRAYALHSLLNLFAPAYEDNTAPTDLGLPLRLSPDMDAPVSRASLSDCYQQVLADAQAAAALLPVYVNYPTRPSRTAAYALLARVYLAIGHYPEALTYADSALALNSSLISYPSLNPTASVPFSRFNEEVIFHSTLVLYNLAYSRAKVLPSLYELYEEGDIRKQVFFRTNANGSLSFKGTYSGTGIYLFGGLATNELYLIQAEGLARKGETEQAMERLNALLATRWEAGSFSEVSASSPAEALDIILLEREKELAFRGLRWSDLRRLNQETDHAKSIYRQLEAITYELAPNSSRYVYPIPQQEIERSGIPQNNRE